MWDDHDREIPIRDARGIPTEFESDQPSKEGNRPRSIRSEHWIKLWELKDSSFKEIGSVLVSPEKPGQLEGEFRYLPLNNPINLYSKSHYMLTMSTRAGDKDHFHDHVAFDGLSPLVNPMVSVIKSVMLNENYPDQIFPIPSFADLHYDYSKFRVPVGPTLRFQ